MKEVNDFSILLKPLVYYNYLIGIVSGVILLFGGYWKLIVIGLLLAVAGFWLLRLLISLPDLLVHTLFSVRQKNSYLAFPFFLSLVLRIIIITTWCFFVFLVLFHLNPALTISNFLFSYFVITAPLNLLSLRETAFRRNGMSYETLLFDFILAIAIFFGLVIDFDILSLVIVTGTLVLAVRILQIIAALLDRKGPYKRTVVDF